MHMEDVIKAIKEVFICSQSKTVSNLSDALSATNEAKQMIQSIQYMISTGQDLNLISQDNYLAQAVDTIDTAVKQLEEMLTRLCK